MPPATRLLTTGKFLVTGEAATDEGTVRVSSQFADLKNLRALVVNLTIAMAADPILGKNTSVIAAVDQPRTFHRRKPVLFFTPSHTG